MVFRLATAEKQRTAVDRMYMGRASGRNRFRRGNKLAVPPPSTEMQPRGCGREKAGRMGPHA